MFSPILTASSAGRRLFASVVVVVCLLASTGCAIKVGGKAAEGFFNEASGEGKSPGLEGVLERVAERELLAELGHQLGNNLASGATDISPEEQQRLEFLIDGLLTTATQQAGKGLREDVSPELRAMVRRDIVETLAEGMRGDLGDSLEETVDRVVTRTVLSLRKGLSSTETQLVTADFIRQSVYMALREGQGYTPGVGETLQATLTENMLDPLETSVDGIADTVAAKVNESAQRTEKTLQAVISALVLILGVVVILYFVTRRQLRRQQVQTSQATINYRSAEAALGLLDDETRAELLGKMAEYQDLARQATEEAAAKADSTQPPPPPRKRSDDYFR